MRRTIILGLLTITLLSAALWLYGHAYIEITLSGNADGETAVMLTKQPGKDSVELKSPSQKIRKLVGRGDYQVLARRGEQSFFQLIKAKGFLATAKVQAELVSEQQREFIGNNPGTCMYVVDDVLLSNICGDSFIQLQTHVPATATQPTYTAQKNGGSTGTLEGIVTTPRGSLALLQALDGETISHFLYRINGQGELSEPLLLPDLQPDRSYSLVGYRDGFLAYDQAGSQFFYYASAATTPERLDIASPDDDRLAFDSLQVDSDTLAITYTSDSFDDLLNFDSPDGIVAHPPEVESSIRPGGEPTSQVILYASGQLPKTFTFAAAPLRAYACGSGRLCMLSQGKLTAYETQGSEPKPLYELGGVTAVQNSTAGLLVVKPAGVFRLDVARRQGFLEYSFGEYRYCGLQAVQDGRYVLCLFDTNDQRLALRINQTQPNTGSIDKKVIELLKLEEIKDLSVYGRFIYISPELGELVYNESSNSFGYPPATIAAVNGRINQEIARLGIDRNTYSIINAFE